MTTVQHNEQSIFTWRHSDYASHYFATEQPYLNAGLKQAVGPKALQIGTQIDQQLIDALELPYLVRTTQYVQQNADLISDPAFLPFAPNSFAMVVLPHVLERHSIPHQVLREAHRVLMSEGHIVITGFNPTSLLGVQRFLRPKAVMQGRYYTVKRVTDWLQLLGFEVVASAMFQYAPLSRRARVMRSLRFLESVGDRWLPMFGGGYMITAKKRDVGMNLVGRVRFRSSKPKLAAAVRASAPRSSKHS